MIKEKLKLQPSIKANITLILPRNKPIEITDAIIFSNEREDGNVMMVIQDKNNANVQVHVVMDKINNRK